MWSGYVMPVLEVTSRLEDEVPRVFVGGYGSGVCCRGEFSRTFTIMYFDSICT